MSMTQEEIEALMNESSVTDSNEDSIDDILDGIDGIIEDDNDSSDDIIEDNIDDILSGIDGIVEDEPIENINTDTDIDIDSMLEGIDGIEDNTPDEMVSKDQTATVIENNQVDINSIENQIESGVLPLPSSKEHKIVNQLNEVAEDSEEKASQIFDVLSYILDENEKVSTNINNNIEFINSQIELLEQLSNKFPNIEVLKENLNKAIEIKTSNEESINIVNEENNKIFEAMEIMQYHDINRQKIERVMSVIKKLTTYLNGIFEDDSGKPEVQIAKHISGDNSETMNDDDLDNLISEFSKDV